MAVDCPDSVSLLQHHLGHVPVGRVPVDVAAAVAVAAAKDHPAADAGVDRVARVRVHHAVRMQQLRAAKVPRPVLFYIPKHEGPP